MRLKKGVFTTKWTLHGSDIETSSSPRHGQFSIHTIQKTDFLRVNYNRRSAPPLLISWGFINEPRIKSNFHSNMLLYTPNNMSISDRLRGYSTRRKSSRAAVELANILYGTLNIYSHSLNTRSKKITFSITLVVDFESKSSQIIWTSFFEAAVFIKK